MKKIITKVAMVACLTTFFAGTALADNYTIGWGSATGGSGTYTNYTTTSGTVTGILSFSSEKNSSSNAPAYNSSSSELRLYYASNGSGGSITLTPVSGVTITGFVMTTSTSPSVKYTVDGGTATSVSASSNTYTVTGISATTSVMIQNVNTTNTQLRIKTIQITYTSSSGSVTPTCESPTFSPEAGTYYGEQNVTISSVTEGATIYYTMNGSDPTTSSSVYSSPISVNASTTIKALAVKSNYNDSDIATATYTIKPTVSGYSLNFEDGLGAYTDWTFTNAEQSTGAITAHGGTYYATTGGKATASFQTKEKVAYPDVFTCYISKTTNNNTSSNWLIQVSADGSTWSDVETMSATGMTAGAWSEFSGSIKAANYTNVYVRLYYNGSTAVRTVDDISLTTYVPSSVSEPTFSHANGTTFGNEGLDVTISAANGIIYYTLDGSIPTTSSNAYSEAIHITTTTTIKAIAVDGSDISTVATATYTYVDPNRPGTQNNPYTVAQARAAIDASEGITGVYATGIVSEIVTAYNSQYGNITYNISADGSTSGNQLQAYRGKSYNGDFFTSADDIKVGDEVVIYGNLKKYNSSYEFDTDNQLVSLNRPVSTTPSIDVDSATVNATAAETQGTITVTYNNITTVSAEIAFYTSAAASETTNAPAWLDAEINNSNNVEYLIAENATTDARTAYLKVWAYDDELNEVYSDLITINQAAPVVDYATLPFAYDGNGLGTLPSGLTQSGLTDKYNSSPKMKFDGTGEYVILHFNERPGILTFDIKGNGFSGGTFDVQTSEDGTTYSNLTTYTELGTTTQSESINNLGENVRYIKWIYTEKSSGNVALGNIALSAYVAPTSHTVSWNAGANTELFVFAGDQNSTINSGDEVTSGTTVWVSVDVDSGYVFESLTVKDANNDDVSLTTIDPNIYYSFTMPASNVIITSSAVVAPVVTGDQYALFTGDLVEGDYIIYYNGSAMKNTVENNRLFYETVTPDNNIITTDDASIVWHIAQSGSYWTIYSAAANAYAAGTGAGNKAQMLADGNDDKALWTVSGNSTYDFVNKGNSAADVNAYLRNNVNVNNNYGFACYSNTIGGALSLYKLVEASPATIDLTATSGGNGFWVSFFNGAGRYNLPDGAQAFTMNNSHQLYRLGDGDVIPQGVAVIIIADKANISLTKSNETGDILASGGANILQGSDSPVTKESGKLYYVLGLKSGAIDFYKYTGTSIPAGKAYFTVNE